MWALRRASVHLRNRTLGLETAGIFSVKSDIGSCYSENFIAEFTQTQGKRGFHSTSTSSKSFSITKRVSSLTGGKSSRDDNGVLLEDHETRHDDEDSVSESDHPVDEGMRNELEIYEDESGVDAKKSPKTGAISGLTEVLISAPAKEASKVLDEWIEAGNEVNRTEVSSTVLFLLNRRLFHTAFQVR